jgi:hypothetical protein
LPVLALLIWMGGVYGHRLPEPGATVPVEVVGVEPGAVSWSPRDAARLDQGEGLWRVDWPQPGSPVKLLSERDRTLLQLPLTEPVVRLGQPQWWHWLFANPAGTLPAGSEVRAVRLSLPRREVWSFGPDWMRQWWLTFLVMVPAAALTTKLVFRIH